MSSLALSRLGALTNSARTLVVLSSASKLTPKPQIALAEDDDHHHDDHHISLPNRPELSSGNSLNTVLMRGGLKVANPFTGNFYLQE